ncbi:homing endonuclease [Caudoviricetes sp.]|nr:homing endonuclease [Caudoviricetes sp.]
MITDEIWKDVPSRPGIKVSNKGRVLLSPKTVPMPKGGVRVYTPEPRRGSVARASKTARHQYLKVQCSEHGNMKVHRLVCEAFHGPAPFPGAVVIHIDENALNNEASNLRWGTQKENMNMPGFIEYCRARTGENSPAYKGALRRKSK